jgi:asparaginyl-tRNA synthetase
VIELTSSQVETTAASHIKRAADFVDIFRIQTQALAAIHKFLLHEGLLQLMPVIVSPITDPLSHPVYEASIEYRDQKLQLTKSMILHKQIAISTLDVRGIYIVSPNVRLEKDIQSDRHLLEFSQLDIEIKDESAEMFRSFMEDLMIHIFVKVKENCAGELTRLDSSIKIPKKPFHVYSRGDLRDEYGPQFETEISLLEEDLFWITDFEREFYDKEDEERKGHYVNYDLVYPEGFGEALSGGERDYKYEILVRKLRERGRHLDNFSSYLELAKTGMLGPSVGAGLGIERLIRFLTKRSHIREITLFPKVPGETIYW